MTRCTITTIYCADPGGPSANETFRLFSTHLATVAGGFTCTQTEGGWTDPRGLLVLEPGRIFTVIEKDGYECAETAINIRRLVDTLRKVLGETEIWITHQTADLDIVG